MEINSRLISKVFRAAGDGVMEPYKINWPLLPFAGMSMLVDPEKRKAEESAKQMQSVMYAIAGVFDTLEEEAENAELEAMQHVAQASQEG